MGCMLVQFVITIVCFLSVAGSAYERLGGLVPIAIINWVFNGIAYSQMRKQTILNTSDEFQPQGSGFWTTAHFISTAVAVIILVMAFAKT